MAEIITKEIKVKDLDDSTNLKRDVKK